ncbi:MAG: DUF2179 domain-containing protein [Tissierella sp.]|uniref:DUF2179 domain-containing protein n=1 Tax=Tissierella sp. TaxID=41274 RepID=UPI003F9E5D4A
MTNIILILVLQLIYVPLMTLRTIFSVKNMTMIASLLGFGEALIYVAGLSLVFSGDQGPLAMLVYALGFGLGTFLGGAIENKLAIGYNNFSVNLMEKNTDLINYLRNEGFGVTVYEGEGRDSKRYRLDILTKRNREEELLDLIDEHEPTSFIVSYEPRRFKGGFLINSMRKAKKVKKPIKKKNNQSQKK